MELQRYMTCFTALLLYLLSPVSALRTQVLSTVIFTRHGERTPLLSNTSPVLTPVGAQQLYDAGTYFRNLYVSPPTGYDNTSVVRGIAPNHLINTQLNIIATNDAYVSASAQAFMQGLYPPLVERGDLTYIDATSILANGSLVAGPQNGMQFPLVRALSTNDVNSIWVGGMNNCPALTAAQLAYFNTSEYQVLQQGSQSFYDDIGSKFLNYFLADSSIGFENAYLIWDYLSYAYNHNTTVADMINSKSGSDSDDLLKASIFSDDWIFAMFANTSSTGKVSADHLQAIAGRTLAYRVMRMFANSINSGGRNNKMNLMFGGFEPMVSFAALAGLITPQNGAFYSTPALGSSIIFELFSRTAEIGDYPNTTDMYVRFLYLNGTDQYTSLVEYSLFGSSPSLAVMSLTDFTNSMSRIMINNVADWCNACHSAALFCPAFTDDPLSSGSSSRSRLSPVLGGVIGALVTLFCAALIVAALMLFGGIRTHRVHTKRRSDLGGFKGAEKLASDLDLTLPKGGAGATVKETNSTTPRGHERGGSWELGEHAKDIEARPGLDIKSNVSNRASFEDDDMHINPFTTPVKPKDQL